MTVCLLKPQPEKVGMSFSLGQRRSTGQVASFPSHSAKTRARSMWLQEGVARRHQDFVS